MKPLYDLCARCGLLFFYAAGTTRTHCNKCEASTNTRQKPISYRQMRVIIRKQTQGDM